MHVVWKRPDGFRGAMPADFTVVEIADDVSIWLHKTERDWFPFQVSGEWENPELTRSLNRLVNLLSAENNDMWVEHLLEMFHNSLAGNKNNFFKETIGWFDASVNDLKGDKWEVEVMQKVFAEIRGRLLSVEKEFKKFK